MLSYLIGCSLSLQIGKSARDQVRHPFGMGGTGIGFTTGVLQICRICDLKIAEMAEFLNSDRPHMQQGLFPDVQQSYLFHSVLKFDEVSIRALAGVPLKANDFLKLEQTFLADIIVEEGEGNEHLHQEDILTSSAKGREPQQTSEKPKVSS